MSRGMMIKIKNGTDQLRELCARKNFQIELLTRALETIKTALNDGDGGSYWPARQLLDDHDIFHGDLNDLRVLWRVAKVALEDVPRDSLLTFIAGMVRALEIANEFSPHQWAITTQERIKNEIRKLREVASREQRECEQFSEPITGMISEVVTLPPKPMYNLQIQLKFKDGANYAWGSDTWWSQDEIDKARERMAWHRNGWPIGGEDVRLVRINVEVIE